MISHRRALAVAAVAAIFCVTAVAGDTKTWVCTAAGGGDWSSSDCWSPAGEPTASDDVDLSAAGNWSCTITVSSEANSIALGSSDANNGTQTLSVRATLTVADGIVGTASGLIALDAGGDKLSASDDCQVGMMDWTSGALSGGAWTVGTLNVVGTGTHTLGVPVTVTSGGAWTDSSSLVLSSRLTIAADASLVASDDSTIEAGSAGGMLVVDGSLVQSGPGSSSVISVPAVVNGNISVGAGSMTVASTLSGDATVVTDPDTVLVIESTGVANFSAGASIATSGTLLVEGTLAMHGEHIYIHEMNVTAGGVVDVTCAAASASDHACGSFDHVVLAGTLRGMSNLFVDRFELLGGEIVGAGAGGDASGALTIDSMTIGGETAKLESWAVSVGADATLMDGCTLALCGGSIVVGSGATATVDADGRWAAECSGGEAGSITVMGTLDLPGATLEAMVPITVLGQVLLSGQGDLKLSGSSMVAGEVILQGTSRLSVGGSFLSSTTSSINGSSDASVVVAPGAEATFGGSMVVGQFVGDTGATIDITSGTNQFVVMNLTLASANVSISRDVGVSSTVLLQAVNITQTDGAILTFMGDVGECSGPVWIGGSSAGGVAISDVSSLLVSGGPCEFGGPLMVSGNLTLVGGVVVELSGGGTFAEGSSLGGDGVVSLTDCSAASGGGACQTIFSTGDVSVDVIHIDVGAEAVFEAGDDESGVRIGSIWLSGDLSIDKWLTVAELSWQSGVISGAKLTVSDHMTMWGSGEKEIDGANVFAARDVDWSPSEFKISNSGVLELQGLTTFYGSMTVANGAHSSLIFNSGTIVFAPDIEVLIEPEIFNSGAIMVGAGNNLEVQVYTPHYGALLKLDGGTVTSIALPWVFASGVVEGEGTIAVADQVVNPVTNGAILHLDAGKVLTIEAGLTHTGTIAVEIASHDAVGAVNVTGAVELFGYVEVVLSPNVTVKEGDTFPFMYFPSIEGAFEVAANGAVAVNADLGELILTVAYGANNASLVAVSAPAPLVTTRSPDHSSGSEEPDPGSSAVVAVVVSMLIVLLLLAAAAAVYYYVRARRLKAEASGHRWQDFGEDEAENPLLSGHATNVRRGNADL